MMDFLEDLENLRKTLNIDKWVLFGGSWGSTLALYYGVSYPKKCLGFILRGIFSPCNDQGVLFFILIFVI